ncbi:hypothetical protein [Oceanomicrobium pacificus]|uniref:Uncharacterized protein n=1 Tax=Oceanomicrobium pacificus TaxID=2692916 RepID=A0A6B0TSR1_9RHOB|nr:hypothetical protein [Oceanomicrobium pacificus]MXU64033.1 hypothetical protein [Oceanomicrobium pacificus]
MDAFLSDEVLEGLRRARKRAAAKQSRLRVQAGDRDYRVLRDWDGGFALQASDAPNLRGVVDLYDGPRHLSRCLIIHAVPEGDELRYEYKLRADVRSQPPRDFASDDPQPAALIPNFD